ncbi:ABC transporter ATP-binding protein [Leucobacter allii]|uniref:ABC transporter ATP-binding protein n=1 Tax=Leucobacter allii TaxID=2932247 RepID=UPI001FD4F7A3|nr:ABC transporter ATP-binding protein [Leucobacter allii]UOR01440.1 ABC transporter ATP-binding protein [Leucobacter allii]
MAQRLRRSVTAASDRPEPRESENVVEVRGLTKSFGEQRVLTELDLTVRSGEFVALLGRSGGGKSTLLRLLEGLDDEYEGEILVPAARSVVFQDPRLLPWRAVWKNVVLGLRAPAAELRRIAERALGEVGLAAKADAWPGTLSGGEAQRVGLARALVREPRLLLLDEPFGALDALTRLKMHGELRQLITAHRPGVILVTHDVQEALDLADRVLVLDRGAIVYDREIAADREAADAEHRFAETRRVVLAALGVDVGESGAQPHTRPEPGADGPDAAR